MSAKKHESLTPLITEAERVLEKAVEHFSLKVPFENIVVTIQSAGRRNAVGWFGPSRWKKGEANPRHEINLSAECLKSHCMGELLLHELAHAENNHLGVKDCSGQQVHNKKFKEMAERLGLVVKPRDKRYGFGFTDLGEGAKKFLEKITFKRELFEMFRATPLTAKKGGTGSRMIKLECSGCGYVVRTSQKWIDAGLPTCTCGEEFSEA